MRTFSLALAVIAGAGIVQTAIAQTPNSGADTLDSPTSLRCSALAEMEEQARAGAILYMAGYGDGQRDALTFGTVGTSTEPAQEGATQATSETQQPGGAEAGEAGGATTEAQLPTAAGTELAAAGSQQQQSEGEAAAPTGGPSAAILPTIDVAAVAAACAQSPDSRIVDIITAQGQGETG